MLSAMNKPVPFDDENDDLPIIDVGRGKPGKKKWRLWVLLPIVVLLFAGSRVFSIYLSVLWFQTLGYAQVYWYMFKLKIELFVVFFLLTAIILRVGFWLLERTFGASVLAKRTILINQQPVNISPARLLRPVAWVVSIIAGLVFGYSARAEWRHFALYTHQTTTELTDPVFHKPIGFYLFTLPIHQTISEWLLYVSFIILCGAIVYIVLALTQDTIARTVAGAAIRKTSIKAGSCALAGWLLILAWRFFLSRYPYLWEDHQIFSGVTYVEALYLLPGLLFVAVALVLAAAIALVNAFFVGRLRFLLVGVAIPIAVYVVATVIVPAYVTNFIVKPNEIGRESPYIEQNIEWTRRAFGIDHIEQRNFDAENSVAGFDLQNNGATLDNIRLWDWHALGDTLKQIQAIRTYYDFSDVDVDRYVVGGQKRLMMPATREIDVEKLPPSSRNWINEKLIYTHGYGLTMNTANGFDPEGMPKFVLSNMPIESTAPEINVARPEIYFGEKTDTDVYVKTKRLEFNYPQGETNNLTTYEGTGGIPIGGEFRRLLLAWALDDITKLPFSDDITSESRVLIHRNIKEIVNGIAPFLVYDNDPYIVVAKDGRLYWMMDAYTESDNFPYSRHYQAGDKTVNYIRNSVKVVIDAYNGSVKFYVFDAQDPLIQTYRATFPGLFHDASEMSPDLRAHVRYPETLIRTQGEVFGLYHTQNTSAFFQREDLWSVAHQVGLNEQNQKQEQAIEPYFVLMQLPDEKLGNEFVEILPFTPSSRNNMIGWMAGRCDGDAYGSLLVFNFPKSRLIDGPLQIEARIDQNPQLSGQFTLWNQQGSHVLRGHLLVIPIGRSLLYVEPVYLQAERSPMPELRLVVLATQDKLGFGTNFEEALNSLFGEAVKPAAETKAESPKTNPTAGAQPTPTPAAATAQTTQQLINRAAQEFDEYQRLTAEGKLGDAGKKLEELKQTLGELKKATGKP
jgi:uncharacterized membrane protein (UPF0182 family)